MVPYIADDIRYWGLFDETFIVFNFNTNDQNLNNLINQITSVTWLNINMYNLVNSASLANDLQWALGQGRFLLERIHKVRV